MANIFSWKGQIQRALEFNQRAFELAEGSEDKELTSASLINMAELSHLLRDYNKAKMYAERAIKIGYQPFLAYQLGSLIDILLDLDDIKNAKMCFQRISELREKDSSRFNDMIYRYYKALLLKSSLRAKDRVKSEILFKEIIDDEEISGSIKGFHGEKYIFAIINLCDLLLIELSITNYPEIIDEIQPYMQKLLDFSEQQHSYWILCETHLLQAKLALISLNLEEAQRFLTQGQRIAEKYGFHLLAQKISNEHDELLKRLDMWENLRTSETSLTERIRLARLNEQMENMTRKRVIEKRELMNEDPILILIVSEGGVPIFTQSFAEDQSFEDHLFGGFFTAINSFISDKFSEGLDRAIFGDHTLLMSSLPPFFICYVFKGQSYSAQQRIRYFIDNIKNNQTVWQTFRDFYRLNKEIELKDIPSLEPLIKEIFIDKSIQLEGLL